jgi:D-alanyl-lipoteichoic acid acyltransferase DltB (MBOAT superfamily)
MLFASPTFLFFFLPGCIAAYFAAPGLRAKNAVLTLASLLFYAWGEPRFVLLMLAMIGFNYLAALAIDARDGAARKLALALALAVNLGLLAVFKYADFAVHTLNALLAPLGRAAAPAPRIPLPLGISFFTFHCLSYLIDTFRRRFPANRNLLQLALYIALFPQLIAGPIVRYKSIARRLRKRRHSLGRTSAGLRIFVIGLAQKLLLADPLANLVASVFDKAHAPPGREAWLGALAYTLQLYFDFAGYSVMAVGLAVVFGFALPRNFRRPYASRSITEFWRRWHISLSTWFRDYLYIPLGGNRRGAARTYRNLVIVFLLCGLWHGAGWTFMLWGLWHGAFLVLERAGLGRILARTPAPIAWAYATIAVVFGWVLFRAPDLHQAAAIWRGMLALNHGAPVNPEFQLALTAKLGWTMLVGGVLAIFGLPRRRWAFQSLPGLVWADNLAVAALLCLSVLRIAAGTFSPFLYFRF